MTSSERRVREALVDFGLARECHTAPCMVPFAYESGRAWLAAKHKALRYAVILHEANTWHDACGR